MARKISGKKPKMGRIPVPAKPTVAHKDKKKYDRHKNKKLKNYEGED